MSYELGEVLDVYVFHDSKSRRGAVVKLWAAGEARDPAEVAAFYEVTPDHKNFRGFCKPSRKDWVVLRKSDGRFFGFCPQMNGVLQQVSRLM